MSLGYFRPASLEEARGRLREGGDAAILAGGHTLLPAMKAGLRAPTALVDLAGVPGLRGIRVAGGRLEVGALVRHADLATDATVRSVAPALGRMALLVGDPQVRARGTVGGALANNDPAADYPAAVLALDGILLTDRRRIAADAFFLGMFTTALEPDEILTGVALQLPERAAYAKFRHPASRYALAGVFVAQREDGVRVAVTGAGPGVFRWPQAEAALGRDFSVAAVARLELDPSGLNADMHAGRDFRANLCKVMLRQAIEEAR